MMKFRTLAAAFLSGLMLAAPAGAATFTGEFWDVDVYSSDPANNAVENLGDVLEIISGTYARVADATFSSSGIDYPNGEADVLATTGSLAAFLGADAASLSGFGAVEMLGSIFRFTGWIQMLPGINALSLASDDGFRLTLDGSVVAESFESRWYQPSLVDFDAGAGGLFFFELIYFEDHEDSAGVEFTWAGNRSGVIAPVPLPGTAPLMLSALLLGGLAVRRSRRR